MSTFASLLLSAVLGLPTPAAPPPPDARLQELVKRLGDKTYRVREDAARELLRRGSAAVGALTAGMKDPDPEVSERCRQLLPVAAMIERNEKLDRLVKDPAAPPPPGLAGLGRFLQVTGDDKAARELYAELMAIHYRTLEAAEKDPRAAAEHYSQFCNEIYTRWNAAARVGRYSYDNLFTSRSDITYFLFLSSDVRLRKHEDGTNQAYMLLYGNQIPKAIGEKDGQPAMRKLFLEWLEKEPQQWLQQRGFAIAAQANVKEALPVALRILNKKGNDTYSKVQVMAALTKLGSKEHIKLLEPYLSDKTQVTTINFGNGDQFEVQARDVAMGVQVRLAGQKVGDYGFDTRYAGGDGMQYHYYGFRDDKSRDEAHAKWKDWKAKNLDKDGLPKAPADKKGPEQKKAESKPAAPVKK
jgi:hypothetical protein